MNWHVTFRIFRYKQNGAPPHFDAFALEVKPDEYVLDAVERIWAEHDRSLVFRHACHHAACGACGMRVNGREKLACITRIDSVTVDGGTLTLEPLRNLPVVSDLVVDMAPVYARMEQVHFVPVRTAEPIIDEATQLPVEIVERSLRFEDCLECGLCVSACPIYATDANYLGPAALAGIARMVQEPRCGVDALALLELADSDHGLWRCHAAFECSEVCPANSDPARLMMALRRQIIADKVKRFVGIRR